MSAPKPIRAVIFDMDGVLTDSEPLINAAALAMFREQGLVVEPADFIPFVGTGEDRYLGGVAEKYRFPIDIAQAKRRTYEIYLDLVPSQLRVFAGAAELVKACRERGLKTAVASSADRIKIEANLHHIGLPVSGWDAVITAENVAAKKPAPDLFLAAATRLGVRSDECTVIEDAINGIAAAKAAGMRCVAVAQTFPAESLGAADLVRPTIGAVTLEDLAQAATAPPSLLVPPVIETTSPVPPPIPGAVPPPIAAPPDAAPPLVPGQNLPGEPPFWGPWATLGLSLVVSGGAVAAQSIAAVIYVAFAVMRGHEVDEASVSSNGLLVSMATILSAPVAVLLCWVLARIKAGGEAARCLGFRNVGWRTLGFWTIPLLALILISDLLTASLGRPVVPDFMYEVYATSEFPPLLWLALIVAAPVSEETLFRGFLFEGLRRSRLGVAGAILIPSILWAAIHLQYDLYGIVTIFVGGLLLGWVRHKTGSLYATMYLHGVMNLVATIETIVLRS